MPSATGLPGAEEPAAMKERALLDLLLAWKVLPWLGLVQEAKE